MDLNNIFETLQWVAYFVLGGLAIYMNVSGKAKGLKTALTDFVVNIVKFINEAEDKHDEIGEQKKAEVVEKLHSMLPKTAQKIISKELIDEVVQGAFDEVKAYATKQLDKVVDKATEVVEDTNEKVESKPKTTKKSTSKKATTKKTSNKKTTNETK